MHPPKIFISATSGDLRSIRQIVKEALLTINCHPVEQTNFEPDARTVENMLRGKIGDCQALIHICGMSYGAEPDVASLPPGTPRRSYTQMEYHIGRQFQEERGDDHFRVYTFICPEDFPYDEEPDTEPQEKRDLQLAHRSRLFDDPHLREKPRDGDVLRLRILALQEHVFALKQEQTSVSSKLTKIIAFIALSCAIGLIGFCSIGEKQVQQNEIASNTRTQVVSVKEDTSQIRDDTQKIKEDTVKVERATSALQKLPQRIDMPLGEEKWINNEITLRLKTWNTHHSLIPIRATEDLDGSPFFQRDRIVEVQIVNVMPEEMNKLPVRLFEWNALRGFQLRSGYVIHRGKIGVSKAYYKQPYCVLIDPSHLETLEDIIKRNPNAAIHLKLID